MNSYIIAHLLVAAATRAADDRPLPKLPPPDYPVFANLEYRDARSAAAAWKPMSGSTAADVARAGDRNVLRMPCNLHGTRMDRASWDAAVTLDLTACRGVTFRFMCPDTSPISHFTLFFQVEGGWYGAGFFPEPGEQWGTVTLEKDKFVAEGEPAGWDRIKGIRFSAWRAGDEDTVVYLADLGALGADAPIAVITGATPEQVRAARPLVNCLKDLDVPFFPVRSSDLQPRYLDRVRLVMLPNGAPSEAAAVEMIAGFVTRGGKLIVLGKAGPLGEQLATYRTTTSQPADPRARVIFEPPLPGGDPAQVRSTVMRLVTRFEPDVWAGSVERAIERAMQVGTLAEPADVLRELQASAATQPALAAALERGQEGREQAKRLLGKRQYEQALAAAELARKSMIEAYCVAQQPAPGEFRAFWCHEASGVKGMNWDQAIRILAENGFTAVLPNMLWGGVTFYPSDVLAVHESARDHDYLSECLAACRKYGVQCHVWKVNWNMSGRTPLAFREQMQREGRTQVSYSGQAQGEWLCPSHPLNRKLEIDSMVELATRYDVDGIHFDYIRYPDALHCYCPGCRSRFEQATGSVVRNWPADVRTKPEMEARWNDFRRSNIDAVVGAVAETVHRLRPGVKVSAAVFRIWETDRDAVAQDWKLWCDRGWLDFVCPMDYTPVNRSFENMIRRQLAWAGRVPCYPGIGLSVWPDRTDAPRLADQITITRRLGTGGFTVFNYADLEAREVLPMLGKGVTRP